jgi:hypothetical protein
MRMQVKMVRKRARKKIPSMTKDLKRMKRLALLRKVVRTRKRATHCWMRKRRRRWMRKPMTLSKKTLRKVSTVSLINQQCILMKHQQTGFLETLIKSLGRKPTKRLRRLNLEEGRGSRSWK